MGLPAPKAMAVYGPLTIGNFIGCCLTGIVFTLVNSFDHLSQAKSLILVKCFSYYTTKRRSNSLSDLIIVGILLVLSTANTVLGCSRVIKLCVLHQGDLTYFLDLKHRPDDWLAYLTSNLCTLTTLSFLAYKAARYTRTIAWSRTRVPGARAIFGSWLLTVFLVLVTLTAIGLGLIPPILYSQFNSYNDMHDPKLNFQGLFATSAQASTATFVAFDTFLTTIFTVQNAFYRSNTRPGTRSRIDSIITYTVRNGLLMTICQLVHYILTYVDGGSWGATPFAFIAKIYALTVICHLSTPTTATDFQFDRQISTECVDENHDLSSASMVKEGIISGYPDTPAYPESIALSRCRSCGTSSVMSCSPLTPKRYPSRKSSLPTAAGLQIRIGGEEEIVGFRAALLELDEDAEKQDCFTVAK